MTDDGMSAPVAVMPERTPHQRPSSPRPRGKVSATAVTMPTAQKPVRLTQSSCGWRPRPRRMPDTVPYTPSGSWYSAANTLRMGAPVGVLDYFGGIGYGWLRLRLAGVNGS